MSEEGKETGTFVTEEFVEKVLKASMKDGQKMELVSSNYKPGSKAGDNCSGVLTAIKAQVRVDGKEEIHHMLLKKMPEDDYFVRDFVNAAKLYTKEVGAYVQVFPYIMSFQQKRGASEVFIPPVPRYYDSLVDGEKNFLVIQDLRPLGYSMQDRFQGLSFEESCLALRALAKLHAVSYAIKITEGRSLVDVFPTGRETICILKNRTHCYMYECTLNRVMEMVEDELGEEGAKLSARIGKLRSKTWDIIYKCYNDYEHPFAVLNHGDVWVNNLLYKYEDDPEQPGKKKPVDVYFVDFQMTRVIPFTLELTYFFYTSTTYDLRKEHLQDLKQVYWNNFIQTLQNVKLEPPPELTYEAFEKNMEDMLPFGLICMSFAIPMQLANPKQATEKSEVYERNSSGMNSDKGSESMAISHLDGYAKVIYKKMSDVGKKRLLEIVREMAEKNAI